MSDDEEGKKKTLLKRLAGVGRSSLEIEVDKPASSYEGFLSKPWLTAYRVFGERIDRVLSLFEDLRPGLLRSGLRVSFPAYVSLILFSSLIALLAGFGGTATLGLVFGLPFMILLAFAFAVGVLCGALTFVVVYVFPSMRADSRRRQLDEEIPYIMSHMAVLSTAGLSPERVFRSLATVLPEDTITWEARAIVRDMDLLGQDLLSAMESAGGRSPSRSFAEFLEGLVATTRSGGDLKKYFMATARGVMDARRISSKEFVETLGWIAELYVVILVVFPLIVTIMFSVMGIISGALAGVSIQMMLMLLTYILVPAIGSMMLILLDAIMPKV